MNAESSERIRLTISVPVRAHAAFQRLASITGSSIGREMGDFLAETAEAVEFTADKMEQARIAPRLAMREMHAYALGLADETGSVLDRMRAHGHKGAVTAAERSGGRTPATPLPPSSLTGGKSPGKTRKARR